MENTKGKQRNAKQRKIIYDAVMARKDHPTADDIYMDVCRIDSKISKGTVYRNLALLSENEEINHVKVPAADRYDSMLEKHCHVICLECGKVEDVPVPYDDEMDSKMQDASGYDISRHRTVFEGICPDCRKKKR